MYEKVAIITQIWHSAKYNFTSISNTWYLITVPNMNKITTFFSKISQQMLKIYEKRPKLLTFGRAKLYFKCISRYLIMVPNIKTIHPAIMEECAMLDRWTDRQGAFLYSPIPLLQSGE